MEFLDGILYKNRKKFKIFLNTFKMFKAYDCIKSWNKRKTFDCFREAEYTTLPGTLELPILLGVHQNAKLNNRTLETGVGFTMKIDGEIYEYKTFNNHGTVFDRHGNIQLVCNYKSANAKRKDENGKNII